MSVCRLKKHTDSGGKGKDLVEQGSDHVCGCEMLEKRFAGRLVGFVAWLQRVDSVWGVNKSLTTIRSPPSYIHTDSKEASISLGMRKFQDKAARRL